MFGWAELIMAFVVGALVATWVIAMFVRRWAERLQKLLREALAEEASKPTTTISKEEALADDKIIPLDVEVENNLYYCYNSKTNQFICQGANVAEIIEKFKQRFPERNAFFESGDAEAIATLKQQLKETRDISKGTEVV